MPKQIIKTNDIYLWCETFGDENNTPILLIQGSAAQGILWCEEFCESLAENGYYVIRYDHRDTGQSSCINYHKNPYTLIDLMNDAKNILDVFELSKAHIVGISMGGYITQLLGIYHSERILTLTLMMTSPFSLSLDRVFYEDNKNIDIPPPTDHFINSLLKIGTFPKTVEGRVNYMLSIWSAYNGSAPSYDSVYWASLARKSIDRAKNLESTHNHWMAVSASPLSRENELKSVYKPTLIIHGLVDPFFPIEHAYALQRLIASSSLVIIKEMGHFFHNYFREDILQAIVSHLQKNND